MAQLDHPNVVRIYDMGEDQGLFYTMEYVEGGNLSRRLRDRAWLPHESARLVATLARAVDKAHSLGVVHRDLKPSNILFDRQGTPKITDFGLAKLIGEQQEDAPPISFDLAKRIDEQQGDGPITMEGAIMGTPAYMAPEQAGGEIGRIGPGTDIHALGAILYEMLAGCRPFGGDTLMEMLMQVLEYQPEPPSRWRPGLPRDLDAICLKCLEKDPDRRYSTAAALADDLERFLAGKSITARLAGAWDRLRRLFSPKRSP